MRCYICFRIYHTWCVESGALSEAVFKVVNAKSVLGFFCKNCVPTGKLVPEADEENVQRKEERKAHVTLINKFKAEQQALLDENKRVKQRNTQLMTEITKLGEQPSTSREQPSD